MSAQIIREIVASSLKIKATNVVLSGVLPEDFITEAVSHGGNLYSHDEWSVVWAFSPEKGLVRLRDELITENAASNANGSWENSYGYTFETIGRQAPDAIFFVVSEGFEYSDINRNDSNSSICLYKAPDFKEYFDKIEQKDIVRWEQWLKVE